MHVAILNDSAASGISDGQAADFASAVATQVHRDFAPAWNLRASIRFIPTGHKVPPGCAWIKLAGTSDEAGALGYHDETPEGLPVGYVFAKDDAKYGADPCITLSHEVLELLLDPRISDVVFRDQRSGVAGDEFHAKEACDAVEADELGYAVTVGGHVYHVSDFVLPDYFDEVATAQVRRFDFMGHLHAPFSLAPGGYQSFYVPGKGWDQRTADSTPEELAARKGPLSRLALRVAKSTELSPHPPVAAIATRTLELLGRP